LSVFCIIIVLCLKTRVRIAMQAKRKYFPIARVMGMFGQITQTLEYCHAQHVLHRDIKPSNIFLTKAGDVKLGDFGLSKQIDATMGKAHTICGTTHYTAPEILLEKKYTNRCDVWSTGCVLYEMLTLTRPFDGRRVLDIQRKVKKGDYYPLDSRLPKAIRILVKMMLSVDPKKRPAFSDQIFLRIYQDATPADQAFAAAAVASPAPKVPLQAAPQVPLQAAVKVPLQAALKHPRHGQKSPRPRRRLHGAETKDTGIAEAKQACGGNNDKGIPPPGAATEVARKTIHRTRARYEALKLRMAADATRGTERRARLRARARARADVAGGTKYWKMQLTADGRHYFVQNKTRKTAWELPRGARLAPRVRATKVAGAARCRETIKGIVYKRLHVCRETAKARRQHF